MLLALVLHTTAGPTVEAAGPLIVNGAGAALTWDVSTLVPWHPDRGPLGSLDNGAAITLVEEGFATWAAVPEAAIDFAAGPALPTDVTGANFATVLGVCNDGLSPVILDSDGTVTDALFGAGASRTVLGFAGPECGTFDPPVITEASAVLNGRFIDGIATSENPEIVLGDFMAVFVHEFGHWVNLDHSQINLREAFGGGTADDDAVATMFPFLVNGAEARSLARDDVVSLALLYPSADFAATTARITGSIRRGNGAPFQGAYVIARRVDEPRRDAIGFASGTRFFPERPGGPADAALAGAFELPGLLAGAPYTVEVEAIFPAFTDGSAVGPFLTPVALPGPPEFWNGADEAASNPPDDPAAPGTPIVTAAGATTANVDIILNRIEPPPNDACAAATSIDTLPFAITLDTRAATVAPDDPPQPCTADAVNSNSVWFALTAPGSGAVTISTAGSTYDTVVSVSTGRCGSFGPVACNDDATDLQAVVTFPAAAGATYLIEVTDFGAPGGGVLVLEASLDPTPPPSCRSAEPGVCIPGGGGSSTDCVTEWLVEPVPPVQGRSARRHVPSSRVRCVDGDPRCDFDGVVGKNGRCTFHVAVCLANQDPRPAVRRCVPAPLASYRVLSPRLRRARDPHDVANATALLESVAALGSFARIEGARVTFAPEVAGLDRCTPFRAIEVPVGAETLRTRAVTVGNRRDSDRLRLECRR